MTAQNTQYPTRSPN